MTAQGSGGPALVLAFGVAFAAASLLAAAQDAKDAAPSDSRELAGQVFVLFAKKCKSCHGGEIKKPEGDFGYLLDFRRVTSNPELVVKGEPGKSELYRLVKEGDMPPADSKVPPLTAEEKELVRRWIAAGAASDLPATLPWPKEQHAKEEPGKKQPAKAAPKTLAELAAEPAAIAMREKARQTRVTLDIKDQPAGEAFAQVAKATGLKVDYTKPEREPRVSIRLKDGTALAALEYLALSGNFSLFIHSDGVQIGPNPPRDPPVLPAKEGK